MRKYFLFLSLVASLAAPHAHAEDTVLSGQRFDVTIRDQNVRDVFAELSVAMSIPFKLSEAVDGQVSGAFDNATASELLDTLARNHGLDWRFDGRRVEVTSKSEQISRILNMHGVKLADINDALDSLGVRAEQFPITAVDGEIGLLVASPGYIALVEIVLEELIDRRRSRLAQERKRQDELSLAMERRRLEDERRRAHEFLMQKPRGPLIIRNGVRGG